MADKNQKTFAGFNDVSIRADVYGDNHERPVLFAHGGGQTRHAWRQTGRLHFRRKVVAHSEASEGKVAKDASNHVF